MSQIFTPNIPVVWYPHLASANNLSKAVDPTNERVSHTAFCNTCSQLQDTSASAATRSAIHVTSPLPYRLADSNGLCRFLSLAGSLIFYFIVERGFKQSPSHSMLSDFKLVENGTSHCQCLLLGTVCQHRQNALFEDICLKALFNFRSDNWRNLLNAAQRNWFLLSAFLSKLFMCNYT